MSKHRKIYLIQRRGLLPALIAWARMKRIWRVASLIARNAICTMTGFCCAMIRLRVAAGVCFCLGLARALLHKVRRYTRAEPVWGRDGDCATLASSESGSVNLGRISMTFMTCTFRSSSRRYRRRSTVW
jgi:hypothetical protein